LNEARESTHEDWLAISTFGRQKMPRHSDIKSQLIFKGEGYDDQGNRYLKLALVGSDTDIPPFLATDVLTNPTKVLGELVNKGANIFSSTDQADFKRWLGKQKPLKDSFKVVARLGMSDGAFVRPGKIVGKPNKRLEVSFRHLDQQQLKKYHSKGTLEEWQSKIGKLCSGNSRLLFCASLALTGPILPLARGPRSGGFQLFGDAESGKTAAATVAGSIWGTLNRASGRFATVFAAGSLAIKYKIFQWSEDDLLQGILACQLDGLRLNKAPNGNVVQTVAGARAKLIAFLREKKPEFMDLRKGLPQAGSHKFGSVPGYIASFDKKNWIYLRSKDLTGIIGSGREAEQLKDQLINEGLMDSSAKRRIVQRRVFSGLKGNQGHKRVYAIRSKTLSTAS
jgi:Domain of unknown function (DUF927)